MNVRLRRTRSETDTAGVSSLVNRLLDAMFDGRVPAVVDELVDRDLAARHMDEFKLGPIFPIGPGATGPVRIAVSDQGEREHWAEAVCRMWPDPRIPNFLTRVPADARRMVDTDGTKGMLYLDDLQDVEHALSAPIDVPLMCSTFDLATGAVGAITRHREPPLDLLSGQWHAGLDDLRRRGAEGIWAIRWSGDVVVGLLWITESRRRDNAVTTNQIVAKLGEHRQWQEVARVLAADGWLAYADTVEVRADGSFDVTLAMSRR